MSLIILPALWLIILLVGLPQLSETVYTPSLPAIASALQTTESAVEHTLTIYLFGMALGTLFWGVISDRFGRKPCILAGLVLFVIGCIGCYAAPSIEALMLSRLLQAFGGSIGSVLGQAVCRDAFHGAALGRVYSSLGGALALFPALGPVIGGSIACWYGWRGIFLFLVLFALLLIVITAAKLPETHLNKGQANVSVWSVAGSLLQDSSVIGYGLIVGAVNGILFGYFAEGAFFLINGLGLSPQQYGMSFLLTASATFLGGFASRQLQGRYESRCLMRAGLAIMVASTALFSALTLTHYFVASFTSYTMVAIALVCQMGCSFGICMAGSNALARALVAYKSVTGTASSLFGFFYYMVISFFTFLLGVLHTGSLLVMPLYFLALSLGGLAVDALIISDE